jgi:hypothetical protein
MSKWRKKQARHSEIATFSSRKPATLSVHSLKPSNHARLLSAFSTSSRISFSLSSTSARSRASEVRVTEFFACEVVRSDSCSAIRDMAGPSEGMGVARGTGKIKTSVRFQRGY